jgi:hypothetical protein
MEMEKGSYLKSGVVGAGLLESCIIKATKACILIILLIFN